MEIPEMKVVCILLSAVCLLSCTEKPVFKDLVRNYQVNSDVFSELSSTACALGQSGKLERYTPTKNEPKQIIELDKLLSKVSGKYIEYSSGKKAQCTLEVLFYAEGFAGVGQKYTYTYQVDSITLYKQEAHTYDKIVSMKDNVSFDMPLTVKDKFYGWYFSFAYNHKL